MLANTQVKQHATIEFNPQLGVIPLMLCTTEITNIATTTALATHEMIFVVLVFIIIYLSWIKYCFIGLCI